MNATPLMRADEIAHQFNACRERQHWSAVVGGTRALPTVIFKSRTGMVELTYYPLSDSYAVSFSKVTSAFGDYMASTYKSLMAVLSALKASGHPVSVPLEGDEGQLRVTYDPKTKVSYVTLANVDDDWQDHMPTVAPKVEPEPVSDVEQPENTGLTDE